MLLYGILVEYVSHRWFMHRRSFKKGSYLDWVYLDHHIEHHAKKRNDVNVDMPAYVPLVMMTPWLLALAVLQNWALLAITVGGTCGYAVLWTRLHRQIHGIELNWTRFLPWFPNWCRHHEKHHKDTRKNFGTVFYFSDHLFRTKA